MKSRLIGLVVILGVAYWYYSGPMQTGRSQSGEERQLQENARIMAKCMRREQTMTAAGGMAGVPANGGDAEQYCADQHNLYKKDGQWYSY